jgi:8-oxo-dGTP pyrophosphatase MutT (NUDIX family)
MIRKWQKIDSQTIADFRIFSARKDTSLSPRTGREHSFFILDSPDWVNVIPVTPDGRIVLIRQYRHGIEQVTLEIPGGMVDGDDGGAAEAGRRELLEETGCAAEEMIYLGSVHSNPAFLNNQTHTYLAVNVRKVQEPQFDGAEDIEVLLADAAEIPDMVRDGRITHALVVAAFYHYSLYKEG